MRIGLQVILFFLSFSLSAQLEEIPVINPSFEGSPARGNSLKNFILQGWFDCAPYYFRGQTPPDIQSGNMEFFDVSTKPLHGNTYLGMVTRQNETWELISQRLMIPLEKGKCYAFDIDLARSESYFSRLLYDHDTTTMLNFNKPIVLRIWGGRNVYEKRELLAESDVIGHTEWRTHHFEFRPKQNHDYLILEAFYKTPALLPYNGNVLLDNASSIQQIYCPGEELAMEEGGHSTKNKVKKKSLKKAVPTRAKSKKNAANEELFNKSEDQPEHQARILKSLDKNKIKEGQTIRIEQLYFKADSSSFTAGSYEVLDEIFSFLNANRGVVIEIGGHTNGVPGQEYCRILSMKRAKAVAEYLYKKGVPQERIVYKGYGKNKPIASNKTALGRQKNQRVEIKILKVS